MLTLMLAQSKLRDLERDRCLAEARAAYRSQRVPAAVQTEPATPMLRRVEG